jgi:putative ABC transport system permease protein
MISEIRYVVRSLLRRKGFALVTILTLALGIGSATSIYSVVDWFLFRQAASPKGVYVIRTASKDGQSNIVTWPSFYEAYRTQTGTFSDFAASSYQVGNVVVERDPVENGCEEVTFNFFNLLGVSPALGREFVKGEDIDGRNQVVVVTAGFAKKSLGGMEAALGRKITISGETCTVVGILREGQHLPPYSTGSVYRPFVPHPDPTSPWTPYLIAYCKTRPGVSKDQAEAVLAGTKVDLPPVMGMFKNSDKPVLSTIADTEKLYRPELYWMLLGAVGFLFAIACLNASNLMLVHMVGKQLETSIRLALGGGRWGILRLLLIETVGLCLCGCALGALMANWLIPVFSMAADSRDAADLWLSWHLGTRTYLVLGGLTLFTGFAIALVPAIHALRSGIHAGLKNGGGSRGESPGLARLRSTFVILQATFAVILLVGAGLMIRTFQKLEQVKLGFDPSHRIKMQVNFPSSYPHEPKERVAALNRLRDALLRVPGVGTVAFSSESLLAQYEAMTMDLKAPDGTTVKIHPVYVSPEYQQAGGISLKRGRWLSEEPDGGVVINESLARLAFPGADPVDQYLKPDGVTMNDGAVFRGWRVAGVVGDVRENLRSQPGFKVYTPASWSPGSVSNFVVDMTGEPTGESTTRLRQAIYQLDPRVVTYAAAPVLDQLKEQLRHEKLTLSVLRVLAAIAILLTIVGLFSVLAYTVDRRMAEFGIRMALGATPANLVGLVMRRGMALTAVGVAAGIAGAMAMTRFLQSLLFETPPDDPTVIASVAALLLLSALGACAIPALRASRPDVAKLLKGD